MIMTICSLHVAIYSFESISQTYGLSPTVLRTLTRADR